MYPKSALCLFMCCSSGSHLLIQPVNSPHLVASALQLLGLSGREAVEWTPAVNQEAAARGCCVPPITISSSQALAYLADLAAVPTRRQVGTRCIDSYIDAGYYFKPDSCRNP
jgi:hypothetical protein